MFTLVTKERGDNKWQSYRTIGIECNSFIPQVFECLPFERLWKVLSVYHLPGIVLESGDTKMNKRGWGNKTTIPTISCASAFSQVSASCHYSPLVILAVQKSPARWSAICGVPPQETDYNSHNRFVGLTSSRLCPGRLQFPESFASSPGCYCPFPGAGHGRS